MSKKIFFLFLIFFLISCKEDEKSICENIALKLEGEVPLKLKEIESLDFNLDNDQNNKKIESVKSWSRRRLDLVQNPIEELRVSPKGELLVPIFQELSNSFVLVYGFLESRKNKDLTIKTLKEIKLNTDKVKQLVCLGT